MRHTCSLLVLDLTVLLTKKYDIIFSLPTGSVQFVFHRSWKNTLFELVHYCINSAICIQSQFWYFIIRELISYFYILKTSYNCVNMEWGSKNSILRDTQVSVELSILNIINYSSQQCVHMIKFAIILVVKIWQT